MARITHQSAKDKGRRLQKWVGKKISEMTGERFGKDCPIESRPMGQGGTDVRLEAHVLKMFPYSIECKAQESWDIHGYIRQAKTNIIPNTNWLLFCKKSRLDAIVVLDLIVLEDVLYEREVSLDDFSMEEHEQDSWLLDVWVARHRFNRKKPWIILAKRKKSETFAIMEAADFFALFPKAPLRRNKKKPQVLKRTKSRKHDKVK